jgi:hypothetical protein
MGDRASRHRVICVGRPVPEGWVIIGSYHNPACDGGGDNALIIKRPGRREVVCGDSPIPEGYAKTRPARLDSCPGEHDNAWVIERVRP